MGLIELLKLAFADDTIFIPLDNEYRDKAGNGKYIWDEDVVTETCHLDGEGTIQKIKDIIDYLPEKPEGEAPEFNLENGD